VIKSKEGEMVGALSTHGIDEKNKILLEKPEGKTSLGIQGRRYEDNIRMQLRRKFGNL
jgi:hypothetical protein